MDTFDIDVAVKRGHIIPYKNESLPSSLMNLQSLSFTSSPLVQGDDALVIYPSDPDIFFSLLYSRIDSLYVSIEKLRKGVVEVNSN